ncbi:putative transmembrane protein [Gregarina niphandrodes]|uniref:Transmembrane protein n=1 Tax=Gregarina niphandrodes TaxID=110365 RepID=A0A023B2Z5_GRENI|nr:putative transmembrane protein [Gregarina niphandrodes]EZG55242.1 putative transmembrane protein [Gregarina niphandrodes]|eukprot:XP_011131693.1 putative transmembrane protein [Gregarina niphandrodes]
MGPGGMGTNVIAIGPDGTDVIGIGHRQTSAASSTASEGIRYILPDSCTAQLVKLGCALAWTGLGLTLTTAGTSICRWLSGHAAQGLFGILGAVLLGSSIILVALFTTRPSAFWRSKKIRLFHKLIAIPLITPSVLYIVQFAVILAKIDEDNSIWWDHWAAAKGHDYKLVTIPFRI